MKKSDIEEKRTTVKVSVRSLVEFILREGDIDNRHGRTASLEAMQEGSRMHRKIQRMMGDHYHAEVSLKLVLEEENYDIVVEGRADGILIEGRNYKGDSSADCFDKVTIDEIKGVYQKLDSLLEPVGVHRAQAMCYAYMFALQHEIRHIYVQMTYCSLVTEQQKYFIEEFDFEELSEWFSNLILEYKKWADFQYNWRMLRQNSIAGLQFPYEYRKGQKELAAGVYRTIARGKILFIQAPTGTGKTISAVFPAVKAVGEGFGERIFYLTAKTITGTVAREAFGQLRRQGYRAKTIQITAKEKLCLCEEMDCNPVHCPYAKGHFDRVNEAVFELLQQEDFFSREILTEQAKKHMVCPFEMCLDTASWADNIICDYNYVFDPNVCLKRFFAEGIKGSYIFLVDEAHNLVERGRRMYSASLCKEDFLEVKKVIKKYAPKLEGDLQKCNKILLDYKRECKRYILHDDIGNLFLALLQLVSDLDEFLQKTSEFPERKLVTEFYLTLRSFLNIYDRTDEHYVIYSEHTGDGKFVIKLYCVDPSMNLQKCLDRGNAAIFFSATLLPIHYYKSLLSVKKDNYAVYAETSFKEEQCLLLVGSDVSSKYVRRNAVEFQKIASYIIKTGEAKKGNYMVFFPSYKMMQQVYEEFLRLQQGRTEADILMQQSGMREEEREAFLSEFEKERDKTLMAFCVMGGIFGEGIDLRKEQLIGSIIVGTGLPQINNEREILQNYYEKRSGNGFDYAYRYPGMNKVLQAAGRVIRTMEDTGVVLLLDERFLLSDYRNLFPKEWEKRKICTLNTVEGLLEEFWKKNP